MLSTQRPRRTREYTGPTPHSVAIRAKMPSGKLPENLILERRRKDDLREEAIQITKYNKMFDLKNDWERSTDRAIEKNTVKRKVKEAINQTKLDLDERRQRLREMLAKEDRDYIEEMEAKQETMEERQTKMAARAKVLKEKRERERQQIAQEKLDQQWRDQCEELRAVISRRHLDEVCVDRMQQLAIKSDMEKRRQDEERMYAELWERDRLAKAAREELEAQQQIERNRAMVDTLRIQKASVEAKRQEEQRLIEEEAKLLIEERQLRDLEEQRATQHKKFLQQQQKETLDKSLKLKMKREAQDRQEELALDMKILEQCLEESRNEAQEKAQRKAQLKDEERQYHDYLEQQLAEEKRREKELDRLVEADVAVMWGKRIAQWKLEKEARNRLMQDVMETRRNQLKEKMILLAREREELKRDGDDALKAIEEHNKMEEERIARTKAISCQYQSDLLAQVSHQQQNKTMQKMEELRQYKEGLETEAKYQAKLKEVLSSAGAHERTHPMRRTTPQLSVVGNQIK